MAILKPKVWHPVAKHGSRKRQNPQILIRPAGTPPRRFSGSAISRGHKPAFHMRQYLSLGRRPNFTAQRWPCLVPGCRFVPSKIAASGIENALLAMTESVGFSEKRDSFQNEMFEKRCGTTPRKKAAYNKKRPFSKQNRPNFVSLRGRPAAVAILKPKVWHPVAKHGSEIRQNPRISNRRGATPQRRFSGSAISRERKLAFHMRQYLSLGQRPNFTAQPYSLARRPNFTAQRWPCLVPGCRFVPSKIAASGIENALLAMTESVGFSEKRDSFQNEMFEKRCGATPRKNDRIQQKASVFQTKPSQFRVIARSTATRQS